MTHRTRALGRHGPWRAILGNMRQFPTPDDGFGLIGDVRTFILDAIEWRAFEYVSPALPHERRLIVLTQDIYHSAAAFPPDWRTLPPRELLERLSIEDS